MHKVDIRLFINKKSRVAFKLVADADLADYDVGKRVYKHRGTWQSINRILVLDIRIQARVCVKQNQPDFFRLIPAGFERAGKQHFGSEPSQFCELVHFVEPRVVVCELLIRIRKKINGRCLCIVLEQQRTIFHNRMIADAAVCGDM